MPNKPNVLFILSDQHNAKLLGHAGHPYVQTPNLDRLAAEGVRFANAICQNPICTPSRVSYLSGQYPHNHGYYGNEGPNPRGLPTLFGHFGARAIAPARSAKSIVRPTGWRTIATCFWKRPAAASAALAPSAAATSATAA